MEKFIEVFFGLVMFFLITRGFLGFQYDLGFWKEKEFTKENFTEWFRTITRFKGE